MYLKDPKNNKPSVSLTMTIATWVTTLGFTVKVALTGNMDPLMNLFYATAALYFGRRITQSKLETKETQSE